MYVWPTLDENAAAALCYTSGTTGHPKGALYANRSTVLHALGVCQPDVFKLGRSASVLPIVPMFHACAWGIPYAAAATGTKLMMPGPRMDPEGITELLTNERVTFSAGVVRLPAASPAVEGLGMGEASHTRDGPPGRDSAATVSHRGARRRVRHRVPGTPGDDGASPLGVGEHADTAASGAVCRGALQLPDETGPAPFGSSSGSWTRRDRSCRPTESPSGSWRSLDRGSWTDNFKSDDDHLTADGWFPTGDVATIDEQYYVQITDRTKDLIKSGGEWISSIDVENTAMGGPDIAMAAVIGIPHEKWGERPLLIVVPTPDASPTKESILEYLSGTLAKWQLPDDVISSTRCRWVRPGRSQKTKLREQYGRRLTEPCGRIRH